MLHRSTTLGPNQPDPDLLHRLFFIQQVCLALVIQIAVVALCAHLFAPLAGLLPASLSQIHISFALAVLFSALSLFFSDLDRSARWQSFSRIFAALTAASALGSFFDRVHPISSGVAAAMAAHPAAMHQDGARVVTGVALILFSVVLILIRAITPIASRLADLATSFLCLLVLILLSELLLGIFHVPGSSPNGLTSTAAIACLVMLTVVAVLRRAERGAFSIFLGSGIGGKIARSLTPILLLLPFLREAGRARLVSAQLLPTPYSTAILASVATAISFILLLYLVARINKMETEIHDLTLRDELTGLYNMRGFNLLAAQSMRLAQRAEVPFSVLFIDLDNLKRINDELGHTVGSASLSETARLLDSTFRDADVIARIGGDEFVVAGQFDHSAVEASAKRLQESAAVRFSDASGRFPLSLSVGYATSADIRFDSLKELVARADQAMYEKKRRKKVAVG
jgi:diguanylate cyclase (GGDEF)-like protein